MGFLKTIKISGIRSIGPGEEHEVEIKFQRPFTLISGQNGAGKTTIIECLKYATSGSFPPGTTKAKGWLHYPRGHINSAPAVTGKKRKAVNITKVPALVYLELEIPSEDGNSQLVQINRKLEGTLKDGDFTTKSLEGTITFKDKKTGKTISSKSQKVEELNKQVRGLLGVNKPVLEFAVFCHQDETLWPFEEAKFLKAKFDEIFQSAEYVKSLEQIKKTYKEASAEIVIMKERQRSETYRVEHFRKEKEKEKKLTAEVAEARKEIQTLTEQLDKVEEEEDQCSTVLRDQRNKMEAVKTLKARCLEIKEDVSRFSEMEGVPKIVTDHNGSVAEIEESITNSEKGDDRQILENQISDKQDEKKSLEEKVKSLQTRLDNEVMTIQQFVSDEKKLADIFEREHNRFPNVETSGPLNEDESQKDFIDGVSEVWDHQKDQIEITEKKRDQEVGTIDEKLQENSVEKTKLETTVSLKRKQMTSERRKIEEIEEQLRSSSQIADRHSRFVRKRDALEKDYSAVEWEKEFEQIDDSLTQHSDEKDILTQRKEKLEEEEERSQITEDLEREKKSKQADVSRMENEVRKSRDVLEDIFSQIEGFTDVDAVSKDDLEAWSMKYSKDFSRNEDALKRQVQALFQKQSEEKQLKKDLVKIQTRLVTNREKIESEILGELQDEKSKLNELTSEETELFEKVQAMEEGKKLFKQFLSSVQKKKCCPVCTSDLSGSKLDQTIEFCKSNMSFKNGPTMKSDLEDLRTEITKKKDHIVVLEEIEKDEGEEAKVTAQQKTLKSQILRINEDKIKLEKKKKTLETIKNKLQLTAFDQFEIFTSASQQLEPSKARLTIIDREISQMGESKSVIEVRNELKSVKDEIKQLQLTENELRQSQTQLSTKQRTLNEQLNKTREEISKLEKSMGSGSEEMIAQKGQLEEEVARIQSEIESTNDHLKDLQKEHSLLNAESQRLRKSFDQEIAKAKRTCEKIASCVTALKNSYKQHRERYQEYSKTRAEKEQTDLTKEIKSNQDELDELIEVIEELQSRRGEFEVRKSKLQMAKTLLLKKKEHEEHSSKYKQAKQDFLDFNEAMGVDGIIGHLGPKLEEIRTRREDIVDRRANLEGEKTAKLEAIAEARSLKDVGFEDREREFFRSTIRVRIEESFARDLDKFSKALGTAIIEVHQKQMTKLNGIITQLWKTSYQGTDIDTISISAKDTRVGASTRSNMDYCVNMHRPDGAVLSMRGRASAGQRMLASLVIRLALMETFSSSGILTLDEPTTNLDKDAIRKFAETIVSLAKTARGYNMKTQFVIITHDKEFTEILQDLATVEAAYRLEKSPDGYTVAEPMGAHTDMDFDVFDNDEVYDRH